jgi:hypothetical protein
MTSFVTDEMVEAALTADMEERAGVNWREVLDDAEQAFEKRIMRASLEAAMKAAWPKMHGGSNQWQHVKTGGIYTVIGECRIEAINAPAYLYRSAEGVVWARPKDEFLDGRFEPLPPAPEAKP